MMLSENEKQEFLWNIFTQIEKPDKFINHELKRQMGKGGFFPRW
jgi:hypothetical protein